MTSVSAEPWPRPPAYVDAWGTLEAEWRQGLASLEPLPWPPPPGPPESLNRLVVVAPHPDDEALGAGGMIIRCIAEGWSVHVVAVSDGEAAFGSEQRSRARRRLARLRRGEQGRCLERLVAGGARGSYDYPSGPVRRGDRVPRARAGDAPDRDPPAGDWCLTTCHWDGHPDHEATGRATIAAARATGASVAEYPIWAWHWATPSEFPWDRARRIDLTEQERRVKQEAINEHRSQLVPTQRPRRPWSRPTSSPASDGPARWCSHESRGCR